MIDKPIRYGPGFKTPSDKALRRVRGQNGLKMFEAVEIRTLLEHSGDVLKAMILLGVNAGFGNNDLATLPRSAVDLEKGWVSHARPKTGAPRRCPLWPETVEALRKVYASRPTPKDPADGGLVFVTEHGKPFVRFQKTKQGNRSAWFDSVSDCFERAMDRAKVKRPGRSFYALRHTHETVGGESLDQVAVDFIMGHLRGDMASVYRERISDDRLRAVAKYVRTWLFGAAVQTTKTEAADCAAPAAGESQLRVVG